MSVTLDDAVQHLNLTNSDEDGQLERFVAAANEWVETRVAGMPTVPGDAIAEMAALFLIEHWWDSKRGPVGSPVSGDEYGDVTIDGRGYAIPNRVRELLGPYAGAISSPSGSFPDAVAWPDPVEWP